MSLSDEEVLLDEVPADHAEPPRGEVVHWMAPGPLRVGPAGLALSALAGFVLGAGAVLGAMAAWRWAEPRKEALPRWRWRRGSLH
jgi:hypothetical protein